MLVSYNTSVSKDSVKDLNFIQPHKSAIESQVNINTNNDLLKKSAVEFSLNFLTYLNKTQKNEDMKTSVVYSDYETTTHPTHKQDITPLPVQTVATFIVNSKRPTIIVYPTVSPESIVIPIVSCILGFPLLALLVICCLRRRAKLARERDRRRNYDMQDHAVSLVRFSPIHRLNNRSSRAISLRPERSLSRGFPSLELDTVLEERSDVEQTQTEIFNSDSPLESTSQHNSCSS